jgi:hypothetical protein
LKILHLGPFNTAGVPLNLVMAHRKAGHESRLVTFYRQPVTFPEDICLNLPLPQNKLAMAYRAFKRDEKLKALSPEAEETFLPTFAPRNSIEKKYFEFQDWQRKATVESAIEQYGLLNYDVYHFDGGLDFFRDLRFAKKIKSLGKKIVVHYFGSDLRSRGIVPELEAMADLLLTNEYDHLLRHSCLDYVFMPYDPSELPPPKPEAGCIRIVHSPTKRFFKGTDFILEQIEKTKREKFWREKNCEFVLLENMKRQDVLNIKSTCHIAIDQVGNNGGQTGYGVSSLETLSMGIATVTDMIPKYAAWLASEGYGNPFHLAAKENFYEQLKALISDDDLRSRAGLDGKAWVERHHSYPSVSLRLEQLYKTSGIV